MLKHPSFSLAAALAVFVSSHAAAAEPVPEWIWHTRDVRPNQLSYFYKTFTVEGRIASATLVAGCDNEMTMFVNGERVAARFHQACPPRRKHDRR
jgi:hypothetical protein